MKPLFVTGNQKKADRLNQLLGIPLENRKVELDEIQSTDLREVVEHKARQAYNIMKQPVLVEDVGLYFNALEGLPGPFIKFFVDTDAKLEMCCRMLDSFSDRSAMAKSAFGYFDGSELTIIEGELTGSIADHPSNVSGWDWDKIFCPDGYGGRTRAELSHEEDEHTYLAIKPIEQLSDFLTKEGYE